MSQTLRTLIALPVAALLLVGGSSGLAEEPAAPRNLNDYLCKDLMRLTGGERENALALVHGYNLGKKDTTELDVDTLAALTDRFIEHCLDHPNDKALAAFEKLAE
jgi:hypothetical protein